MAKLQHLHPHVLQKHPQGEKTCSLACYTQKAITISWFLSTFLSIRVSRHWEYTSWDLGTRSTSDESLCNLQGRMKLGLFVFIKYPHVACFMAWEGVKPALSPLHTGELASAGTLNPEELYGSDPSCLCFCVYFSVLCEGNQWCVALCSLPGPPAVPWRQVDLILAIRFNSQNVCREPRGRLFLEDL